MQPRGAAARGEASGQRRPGAPARVDARLRVSRGCLRRTINHESVNSMNAYKTYVVPFAIVVSIVASEASAQEGTLPLSLEDAQARAVAASHRLAEARAREAAAAGVVV